MHVVFLGGSGAIPSLSRDTTFIAFAGDGELLLIDCGGSPLQKLERAGCDIAELSRVVITHTHPDHAYGLPSLVQGLMLKKRSAPLFISCRIEHVEDLETLLELFSLAGRSGGFPIVFEGVEPREGVEIARHRSFVLTASPNAHGTMPNLALRVDASALGRSVVYSSDTEPCESVVRLAKGADTLIHEATFPHRDRARFGAHSSARQAGEAAKAAGVKRLILTHIDAAYHAELSLLVEEAREAFDGEVIVSEEFRPYLV